jgi:hypothetical protein
MKLLWKVTPDPREETAAVVRDRTGKTALAVGDTSPMPVTSGCDSWRCS